MNKGLNHCNPESLHLYSQSHVLQVHFFFVSIGAHAGMGLA